MPCYAGGLQGSLFCKRLLEVASHKCAMLPGRGRGRALIWMLAQRACRALVEPDDLQRVCVCRARRVLRSYRGLSVSRDWRVDAEVCMQCTIEFRLSCLGSGGSMLMRGGIHMRVFD